MEPQRQQYLNHSDRCDAARCGARAYVRIVDPDTLNDLLFCAHHARQYHRVIEDGTFIVYDDRWILDLPLDAMCVTALSTVLRRTVLLRVHGNQL